MADNPRPPTAPVMFNWLRIVIIVLAVSYLANSCQNSLLTRSIVDLNYTQLTEQIKNGNVESIIIHDGFNGSEVEGKFVRSVNEKTNFKSHVNGESLRELSENISSSPKTITVIHKPGSENSWTNTIFSWLPALFLIGFWIYFMRRMQSGGNQALSFGKSKAKLVANGKKVTFADVAGQDEAKEELQEIVEFLQEPQKFQKLGGRIPKGVLMVGPPGVGKTLLARAVAGEANAQFFSNSGSDFVEMFVGVGASRVRDLFDQGKKNAPSIVFIDELDAVGRHRGAGIGGGHDEREQTLNALLVEMDGFNSNEGVIIIAATNRPDVLDPALLRPGRFDRRVVLSNPDIKGREGILNVHSKKIPLDPDANLSEIARGTPGFSGADLANLINEAALNAARRNRKNVTQEDLEFAKDKVMMGSERRSMVISEEEKTTTAVHEAGHALVSLFVPKADPIHKVTIIPRGMALGLTQHLPTEEQHNHSKEHLTSWLAILMGGRAAEEVVLGQKTTGASNDIERATELARRMVCEWGMSDKLGPQNFVSKESGLFLARSLAQSSHNYSEQTAREIDDEVKTYIDKAHDTAKKIIKEKVEILQQLKDKLLVKEVLTGDEIRKIAGM